MRNARNILKLHEIITTKLHVVFITELCKESLSQKLKSNNAIKKEPLPRPEAIKIIKEVLVGYYWMREHGLLHRDIKPANILMGEDGEARLGDFGFSIRDE
jgi:serine/threonine-protein kinase